MKDNGYVFGAYTHCAWSAVKGTVADPTGRSFLISLVNADDQTARFSLKAKDRATDVHGRGILFGTIKMEGGKQTTWPNLVIMDKGLAADQKDANIANSINATRAYQPDDGQTRDATFLAGQSYFAAEEFEVFQL